MSNASSCFFPDGITTGAMTTPNFGPCDPSAPQSACCAIGETCVGSGLCLSSSGTIYRGGCTDKTWGSAVCPSKCISNGAGPNAGVQNAYTFLFQCYASTGAQWVCDTGNGGNCSDLSTRFHLIVGAPRQVNITGIIAPSFNTSTVIPTATSTTSAVPSCSSTGECKTNSVVSTTTVVAGAAVPLGILLLLSIVWALWERQKRLSQQFHPRELGSTAMPVRANKYSTTVELPGSVRRFELRPAPYGNRATHEMR